MTGSDVVQWAGDLAWVDDGTRVAVLRLATPGEPPLLLENSARAVWLAVGKGADLGAVVDNVAQAYEVDPGVVENDVLRLVEHAVAFGLVKRFVRPITP